MAKPSVKVEVGVPIREHVPGLGYVTFIESFTESTIHIEKEPAKGATIRGLLETHLAVQRGCLKRRESELKVVERAIERLKAGPAA